MKKILLLVLILPVIVQAADTQLQDLAALVDIIGTDVLYVVDDPAGVPASRKITALNLFDMIDTFAELNAIVVGRTLVNEEDAATLDALWTFDLGLTITTGDPLTFGVNRIDNGADLLDGEMIGADTIDDDSIDWADCTFADFDFETAWKMWHSNAAGDVTEITLGADGTFLESNGAAANPAFRALVDNDVPDDITVDLATLATTVTLADDEATADNQEIVFTTTPVGAAALETDGDFHYNPSTGTVTATEFVGGGAGITGVVASHTGTITWGGASILESGVAFQFGDATDATLTHTYANTGTNVEIAYSTAAMAVTGALTATNLSGTNTGDNTDAETGDSATAFFDAGTIEHEWGGLQANLAAYTGLIGITGADTTVEVDSKSELEVHIVDVADFAEADGDTWTGTHDLSGATVTMPKRTKNDDRFYTFNLFNPNLIYDKDTQMCFEPNLPAAITITEVTISCDADPTTELDIDLKWADAFIGLANATLIEPIDTTSGTTDIDSGFDDATVAAGKCLYVEFGADPDSNITQAIVKIRYDFD